LAVKRRVSSSTQNQAFNALLFFFRHVFKKEFGKVNGVVRAKRKLYVPVVLSREEVDAVLRHLFTPYDLNYAGVFLVNALERKYKNAAKEFFAAGQL